MDSPAHLTNDDREHQLRALYRREELRAERNLNRVSLAVAACLVPILMANIVLTGWNRNATANFVAAGVFACYHLGLFAALRRGMHHPAAKYFTITLMVSVVSASALGYALASGWVHALRSCTLAFYFLALALAAIYQSPRAAFYAGILAAAHYSALFAYAMLATGTPHAGMETFERAALSWDLLFVFAPAFLLCSGALAAMTRRSRLTVVRAVLSEASRSKLERLRERLEDLAWHDVLTGLNNRRRFDEDFAAELRRQERYAGGLSLLLLDIDRFKQLNDNYGHSRGDRVLVLLANVVTGIIRQTDHLARWWGEEFTVLCPGTRLEGARILAEKLRHHVARIPMPEKGLRITVSIGVTEHTPGDDADSMLERADNALYAAKRAGRDRVEVMEAPPEALTTTTAPHPPPAPAP